MMRFAELMSLKDSREMAVRALGSEYQSLIGLKGLDKKPWIYPIGKGKEVNGTFWWLCDKSTLLYGSLSLNPEAQIFLQDEEGVIFRITGKAEFREDEKVIAEFLKDDETLDPTFQIVFFLKDARITITSLTESVNKPLKISDETPVGVTLKKDREIRDRLASIIEERKAAEIGDVEFRKLCDGILLVFGERAKKLWPSFNLMPLENSLLYETWDEREKYQNRAAEIMGNITIKQVEDLTYYLSEETLRELAGKRGL